MAAPCVAASRRAPSLCTAAAVRSGPAFVASDSPPESRDGGRTAPASLACALHAQSAACARHQDQPHAGSQMHQTRVAYGEITHDRVMQTSICGGYTPCEDESRHLPRKTAAIMELCSELLEWKVWHPLR